VKFNVQIFKRILDSATRVDHIGKTAGFFRLAMVVQHCDVDCESKATLLAGSHGLL
jgi:hypothetical protein